MGLSELVLIYALNNAVWSMTDEGMPQICMSVPTENSETFKGCTAVPEEILLEWLKTATIKAWSMDPVTLVATASAAFNGLKQLVQAGRELEDCVTQLSQWAGAVADIDKADEQAKKRKASLFKSLIPKDGKSIQQQAMEAYTAKLQVRKQRDELRQLISTTQGINGWHEFIRMENEIRKQRQDTVHDELERRQKVKDLLMAVGLVVLAIGTLGLFLVLVLAIKNQ